MAEDVVLLDPDRPPRVSPGVGTSWLGVPLLLVTLLPLNLVVAGRIGAGLMADPEVSSLGRAAGNIVRTSQFVFLLVAILIETAILLINRHVFASLIGRARDRHVDSVWFRSQLPGIVGQWFFTWQLHRAVVTADGPPPVDLTTRAVMAAAMLVAAWYAYRMVRSEFATERPRAVVASLATYGFAALIIAIGW